MKKKFFLTEFVFLFFIIVVSMGCRTTFTNVIRQDMNNHNVDIKKIYFYNSEEIELNIDSKVNAKYASRKGTYRSRKGTVKNLITIPAKTQGVVVQEDNNILYVSFHAYDDNKSLPFKLILNKYILNTSINKTLIFDSVKYKVSNGRNAFLLISTDDSESERVHERVLKGRKLP